MTALLIILIGIGLSVVIGFMAVLFEDLVDKFMTRKNYVNTSGTSITAIERSTTVFFQFKKGRSIIIFLRWAIFAIVTLGIVYLIFLFASSYSSKYVSSVEAFPPISPETIITDSPLNADNVQPPLVTPGQTLPPPKKEDTAYYKVTFSQLDAAFSELFLHTRDILTRDNVSFMEGDSMIRPDEMPEESYLRKINAVALKVHKNSVTLLITDRLSNKEFIKEIKQGDFFTRRYKNYAYVIRVLAVDTKVRSVTLQPIVYR